MLQQTRVAAVIPFYEPFLNRFPTVESLAAAPELELLQAWAGLGYYSRARNLQEAAARMAGEFPDEYDAIRAMPGIGEYTAAAIASIAFGLPFVAVDGNVLRVVSRLTADASDISAPRTREQFRLIAKELLDHSCPGDFNQAMMELGATICLPRNPQCLVCPVSALCEARKQGRQNELPVKIRRGRQHRVERVLLAIRKGNEMLFWQRPKADKKLAGFWDLPGPEQLLGASPGRELGRFRHSITNTNYVFSVRDAKLLQIPSGYHWLPIDNPVDFLFSTTTRKALRILSLVEGV